MSWKKNLAIAAVTAVGAGGVGGIAYELTAPGIEGEAEYEVQTALGDTVRSAGCLAIREGIVESDNVQGIPGAVRVRLDLGRSRNLTVWMFRDADGNPQLRTAYQATLIENSTADNPVLTSIFTHNMFAPQAPGHELEADISTGEKVLRHTIKETGSRRLIDAFYIANKILKAEGKNLPDKCNSG